jgi:ATP diphosphatase
MSRNTPHPIEKLMAVMAKLRDANGGCPWDLAQDFKSIAPYTIEEAYEVADAIDRGDMNDLKEELGDLLLQSVYHAQMAAESGAFDLNEVINGVIDKMIFRHPHVFGDGKAESAEDVNVIWDAQKAKEKGGGANEPSSALDGVPMSLPSLLRAQKILKKASKTGFEWKALEDVLDKLDEEILEIRTALKSGSLPDMTEEMGDILFVLANFARMNGINAEEALRQACNKFIKRFKGMECDFKLESKNISNASLPEMEQMWVRQKKKNLSLKGEGGAREAGG